MKKLINRRRTVEELRELEHSIAFWSTEAAEQYGRYETVISAGALLQRVPRSLYALAATWLRGNVEPGRRLSRAEIRAALLPDDIVASAGVWDNVEFINFLEEHNWFDGHAYGLRTPDGGITWGLPPHYTRNVYADAYDDEPVEHVIH